MLKTTEKKLTIIVTDTEIRNLIAKAISDELGFRINSKDIIFSVANTITDDSVILNTCVATYEEKT